MATSFRSLYLHIVFSTKNREPVLLPPNRHRVFSYLTGILNHLDCNPVVVDGYSEHVHLAIGVPATVAPAVLVREAKAQSSRWAKEALSGFEDFAWQSGYAAFSFSRKDLDAVCRYVRNQHAHHQQQSFEDEYREFLDRAGIEFDERYLFG